MIHRGGRFSFLETVDVASPPDHTSRYFYWNSRVRQAAPGTAITRAGEQSDAAFFILAGRTVAGTTGGEGEYRALSSMATGDIFGEIAALTGSVRTADVVAEEEAARRADSEVRERIAGYSRHGILAGMSCRPRVSRATASEAP